MAIPRGISLPKQGIVLLISFLIMSSLIFSHAKGDHGNEDDAGRGGAALGRDPKREDKGGPDPVERAIGFPRLTSHWNALRSWAKHAWLSFRPPESMAKSGSASSNVGEVMKEAAARSFETSKETMEKAASTAAKAAEEAVEKTKEKMKKTVAKPGVGGEDADAEL